MTDEELTTILQEANLTPPEAGYSRGWLKTTVEIILTRRPPWCMATNAALVAVLERLGMKNQEVTLMEEMMARILRKAYPPSEEKEPSTPVSVDPDPRTDPFPDLLTYKSPPTRPPELATCLGEAGFYAPVFKDVNSIWLSHLACSILRKEGEISEKELTALSVILINLLHDRSLERVYRKIQKFLYLKENP